MRIIVNFTENKTPVPNNLQKVTSWFHKCMGPDNEFHDGHSDYCISGMCGGTVSDGGRNMNYPKGGHIIFTTPKMDIMNRFIMGVLMNPGFGHGMKVANTEFIEEKVHGGYNHFKTTEQGFILKERTEDDRTRYCTLEDGDFIDKVKNHIIRKFGKLDKSLKFDGLEVSIEKHPSNKTRKVLMKGVTNRSNVCQLNINCDRKLAKMIYDYGIGQSTGSGFGTVYKTENVSKYIKNGHG